MDLSALCVYTGYYFMYIGTLITFLFRRAAPSKITHNNLMTKLHHGILNADAVFIFN